MLHPLISLSLSAVAFVDVNVVPMDREVVLPGQTVVVDAGRIVSIGPTADVTIPEGAQRIEGAGRYLMPGLADMHVHTWDKADLLLFVANGVTTVRNMFGDPMHLEWKQEINVGDGFGPWIYTAGPIIDGDPPVWPGSTVLTDPERATEVARTQREAGYDFVKPYSRLKLDVYNALLVAARKQGLRIMGHVPDAVGLEHAIRSGQNSVEHLIGFPAAAQAEDSPYRGKVDFATEQLAWKRMDEAKLATLARKCALRNVWNCPTLVVMQKWCSAEEGKRLLERPEMRFVAPVMREFWNPETSYLKDMSADFLATVRAADEDRMRTVRILHEAKARILLGTDTGNPYVVPGFAVHEELANLVQAGLSPYEALRAGTSGAAEFMLAVKQWGTVAVDRRADLLLVEKNPLEDVRNAALRVGVMVRGKWYPEAELQAKLAEQAKRLAK